MVGRCWCRSPGRRKFGLLTTTALVAVLSFALNLDAVRKTRVGAFYAPAHSSRNCRVAACWPGPRSIARMRSPPSGEARSLDRWLQSVAGGPWRTARRFSDVLSYCGLVLLAFGFWRINGSVDLPGFSTAIPVLGALPDDPRPATGMGGSCRPVEQGCGMGSPDRLPTVFWHSPLLSFARVVKAKRRIPQSGSPSLCWPSCSRG